MLLFSPDIWGSVSDWFMVMVTTVTAYYLYKTLRSQKEVQSTQTKLFEIESIRFRESIKPILKYKLSEIKFHPSDKDKRIVTLEVTNETDNLALEIRSVHSENSSQVFIPLGMTDIMDHLKKGGPPKLLHFQIGPRDSGWIIFALTYKDVAGTRYKQGVCCIDDKRGNEIHPFLPEIITDEDKKPEKEPAAQEN